MSTDPQSTANIHNRYSDNTENLKVFSIPSIMGRCQHTDWDACEMFRLQELNEARQRAAQMEKTMRWWSECTASWRQKWGSVRNERNQAREEAYALKEALKVANDEIKNLQTEKRGMEIDLAKTKAHIFQLQKDHILSRRRQDSPKSSRVPSLTDDDSCNSQPIKIDASTNTDLPQTGTANGTLENAAKTIEVSPSTKRVQMFHSIGYVRELQAQLSDVFDDLEKMKVSSEVEASRTSNHLNRKICLDEDAAAPLPSAKEFEMVKCERDEAISEVQTLRMEKEFLMRQLKMLKKTVEHAFMEPPVCASNSNANLQLLETETDSPSVGCPTSTGKETEVPNNDDCNLATDLELSLQQHSTTVNNEAKEQSNQVDLTKVFDCDGSIENLTDANLSLANADGVGAQDTSAVVNFPHTATPNNVEKNATDSSNSTEVNKEESLEAENDNNEVTEEELEKEVTDAEEDVNYDRKS